jgi:SAM-dependent methyltransferase
MMPDEAFQAEEDRIRAVYDARKRRAEIRKSPLPSPGDVYITQSRDALVLRILARETKSAINDLKVLEVGCGSGGWLRTFVQWGFDPEKLFGVELLVDRVQEARKLCAPLVTVKQGNASRLDFADDAFDIVLQSTVFTSILSLDLRRAVAAEMLRVTKPRGFVLWYDFHVNNPRNPDVRGIGKREIRQLFPHCDARFEPITLAPPLARRLAPFSFALCRLLEAVPLSCTHYLAVIRKR